MAARRAGAQPGDEFDGGKIEQALRSAYRTGLVSVVEIKQEQPTPDTVNLVVIVTPR